MAPPRSDHCPHTLAPMMAPWPQSSAIIQLTGDTQRRRGLMGGPHTRYSHWVVNRWLGGGLIVARTPASCLGGWRPRHCPAPRHNAAICAAPPPVLYCTVLCCAAPCSTLLCQGYSAPLWPIVENNSIRPDIDWENLSPPPTAQHLQSPQWREAPGGWADTSHNQPHFQSKYYFLVADVYFY